LFALYFCNFNSDHYLPLVTLVFMFRFFQFFRWVLLIKGYKFLVLRWTSSGDVMYRTDWWLIYKLICYSHHYTMKNHMKSSQCTSSLYWIFTWQVF
jgi:hypothetical protein